MGRRISAFLRRLGFVSDRSSRKRAHASFGRPLAIESLESRNLLAVMWINKGSASINSDGFNTNFPGSSEIARSIAQRAVDDWNAVIDSFNYAEDLDTNPSNDLNDVFDLTISALNLGNSNRGQVQHSSFSYNVEDKPTAATVELDNNAVGAGWFFDLTPDDDAEFTALVNSGANQTGSAFQGSFVNVDTANAGYNDFYRTVVHEIGHALGLTSDDDAAIADRLFPVFRTDTGVRATSPGGNLSLYDGTNVDAMFAVAHLFEGPTGAPYQVNTGNPANSFAVFGHANDLMNPGHTVPPNNGTAPNPTTRQYISDLNAQILADAYGYTVTLPSTLNSAHVTLDSQTGTLLVQGRTGGQDDFIELTLTGPSSETITVTVNDTTENVSRSAVSQILIAPHGGNDGVYVTQVLQRITSNVQYVVSSNEDAVDAGTHGDGLVDLDAVVPGNQVTLRAAIQDANDAGGLPTIYAPRGNYELTLAGGGGDAQGDFDITGKLTIIGTGAGSTIIDASTLSTSERIFQVTNSGASLKASRLTLTGGNDLSGSGGGAIYADLATSVELNQVAIAENSTTTLGGAIRVGAVGTTLTIRNSVISENTASTHAGAIWADPNAPKVTIGATIFANNTGSTTYSTIYSDAGIINEGNNLVDDNSATYNSVPYFSTTYGDYIGTVDHVVTSVADTLDHVDDGVSLSAREAIDLALAATTAQDVWLPAWHFRMSRAGTGGISQGDFDIPDDKILSIRGTGAGLTIIDAGALQQQGSPDRIFEVQGADAEITVERMTFTGGKVTTAIHGTAGGGAIYSDTGSTLYVNEVAFVENVSESTGGGGAIRIGDADSVVTIHKSVFTQNVAENGVGGAIAAFGSSGNGSFTVGSTVFANNTSDTTIYENFYSDFALTNDGYNVLDNDPNPPVFFDYTTNGTDYLGSAEYVVTSVADTYDGDPDTVNMSLRDAIDLANDNSGDGEI
jgi:CSLREA domain-containing protein